MTYSVLVAVLCLDTSGTRIALALATRAGELVAGVELDVRAQQALEHLAPLLADAGLSRSDIEAIVVGTGPGGFTGLRVGVTLARGLAEALGVPLHGVGSLEAQAASSAHAAPGSVIWSVLDARRGEYFAQRWTCDVGGVLRSLDEPHAIPANHVAELDGTVVDEAGPSAASLARAAAHAFEAGGNGDPLAVTPGYVRGPDATPPRPKLRIDAMQRSDLDAVLAIEARCFETPWTPEMYVGELERPDDEAVLLVARDLAGGARIVAAALAARIGDSWHVMNVLVDPPARRRGIAARLLDELLERTRELGEGEGWTLEVRASNDAAIKLYASRGFMDLGRRRGYYSDTGEDACIMSRPAEAATGQFA